MASEDEIFAQRLERSQRTLLILAGLALLLWTAIYFQFSIDDAYISYRYGKTLVVHHVWNWNPSGVHEEAYTSAVYTVLSILPAALRVSPALFFKCVGLLCVAWMGYRLYSQSRSRFACLVGVLLLAFDPWVLGKVVRRLRHAATPSPVFLRKVFRRLDLGVDFVHDGSLKYLESYTYTQSPEFGDVNGWGALFAAASW